MRVATGNQCQLVYTVSRCQAHELSCFQPGNRKGMLCWQPEPSYVDLFSCKVTTTEFGSLHGELGRTDQLER